MNLFQLTFPGGPKLDERQIFGSDFKFAGGQGTLGAILSEALKYVFPLAGLILLFYLIAGGFQMMTSAGNPEAVKAGQGKIVSALIGFVIIFTAYWLMQLVEVFLGFRILG